MMEPGAVRVHLTLNAYQLANVLRAIRMATYHEVGTGGDWQGEMLQLIDEELRAQGFCLDETFHPDVQPWDSSGRHRDKMEVNGLETWLRPRWRERPNAPYPDDFKFPWYCSNTKVTPKELNEW